jgi:hypothetical protein
VERTSEMVHAGRQVIVALPQENGGVRISVFDGETTMARTDDGAKGTSHLHALVQTGGVRHIDVTNAEMALQVIATVWAVSHDQLAEVLRQLGWVPAAEKPA